MSPRARRPLVLVGIVAALVALNLSCTGSKPEPSTSGDKGPNDDASALIESHRGQVLVLLMGMVGCPGTAAATAFLKDYAASIPPGAAIVRLDVPPPAGKCRPADAASFPFQYAIDTDRAVADKLEFFYYPTLYILDADGELRFSGGCDKQRLPEMVSEILAEKPGDTKHVYTPPLPPEGSPAPAFSGTTLDGETVTLDDLRGEKATALIFTETGCPFSKAAVPGMKELQDAFADEQVAVVIINKRESPETIRPVYDKSAPGVTVVVDEASQIAAAYSVSPVPFCFVLDADGTIAKRMPYTQEAATLALNGALGIATGMDSGGESGAG